MSEPTKQMVFSVAGVNMDPISAKNLKNALAEVENTRQLRIFVRPEPTNPYDSSALKVFVGDKPIGYIAKTDQLFLRERKPETFIRGTSAWMVKAGQVWDETSAFCYCSILIEAD